jgi:UDP-N-acetylglucosamine 2-epimerase (non-hydrolysing)
MAPVMRVLETRQIPFHLVFTGQHKATMQELLVEFGIHAQAQYLYDGAEISGIGKMLWWVPMILKRLLKKIRHIMHSEEGKASVILVHGDTFSTLIGALAGKLRGSKVVHVESGLRSFNWFHPFPEELTRLAVFRLADVAMCPGEWATGNMKKFPIDCVNTRENTLLDAVRVALHTTVNKDMEVKGDYCVVSIHRFENIFRRHRLEQIIKLIELVSQQYHVIFVLHPATEKRLIKCQLKSRLEGNEHIQLVPRMTYVPFVQLIGGSRFVITDGGSNQEELYYMGVPTLLMRSATERKEGVGSTVTISNYSSEVVDSFLGSLSADGKTKSPIMMSDVQPSERIVDALLDL